MEMVLKKIKQVYKNIERKENSDSTKWLAKNHHIFINASYSQLQFWKILN